jgi:hypothetical protein
LIQTGLHQYLSIDSPCNRKVVKACGLSKLPQLPSRRTFDRRLKIAPMDIKERIRMVGFYESALGQVIYSKRGISIEPLIEHIKSVFRIDQLPVRGYDKACAIVLLSVLLHQILVYHNCKTEKEGPKAIKYLMGC